MEFQIETPNNLNNVARAFLTSFHEQKVFAFSGEMGSGKTTFINSLLNVLGVHNSEGSPTYSLVNTYDIPATGKLFHMDLYRLNDESEAYDMGIEEMLFSNGYCFIEWPEKITNLLPENTIWVYIRKEVNESRIITIENGY
jgi:tRNA threonylcarbamoyladenosine biosynthesis protein TsaE